jgi:nitroreductase
MTSDESAATGARDMTPSRDPDAGGDPGPRERIRPLLRTRQVREFTDQPVDPALLAAIADAGRWSGSSQNGQPWRFIVIRDIAAIRRLAEAGPPQTRALRTATAAVAVVLPDAPERTVSDAYDDGRASERMLVAATMLGLGAGIAWIRRDVRPTARDVLGLPEDRMVRTILAVGHPTEKAREPKSPPGQARLPRAETVFDERWPGDEPAH